jgi:hypothetical protein
VDKGPDRTDFGEQVERAVAAECHCLTAVLLTTGQSPMFRDLESLATCPLPADREKMPPMGAFQFGAVGVSRVKRENPEHADWIYHSPRRPLQGALRLPTDHSVIGGTRSTATIGTSEPLGRTVLDGRELVPYNSTVRAGSIVKTLQAEHEEIPRLAAVREEKGNPTAVRVLSKVPEHGSFRSVVRFVPDACPAGHTELQEERPYSTHPHSLLSGIQTLLRGPARLVSPSIADTIIKRWMEAGAPVPAVAG